MANVLVWLQDNGLEHPEAGRYLAALAISLDPESIISDLLDLVAASPPSDETTSALLKIAAYSYKYEFNSASIALRAKESKDHKISNFFIQQLEAPTGIASLKEAINLASFAGLDKDRTYGLVKSAIARHPEWFDNKEELSAKLKYAQFSEHTLSKVVGDISQSEESRNLKFEVDIIADRYLDNENIGPELKDALVIFYDGLKTNMGSQSYIPLRENTYIEADSLEAGELIAQQMMEDEQRYSQELIIQGGIKYKKESLLANERLTPESMVFKAVRAEDVVETLSIMSFMKDLSNSNGDMELYKPFINSPELNLKLEDALLNPNTPEHIVNTIKNISDNS